ncbi:hypothetical protein QOZ80_2AG0137660 [Eleusine coracana subsp. coracana]|nr:hypothetical protein QOZ80_2AG0137660 [Eleusine coracana subsp. coracana]
MGAYSNEEHQPVLPRYNEYGGSARRRQENTRTPSDRVCGIIALGVILLIAAFIWYANESSVSPHYDIVITGISGLTNPVSEMKQDGVLLNPAFNLTVGIASKSRLYGACIGPNTIIKLSYSYAVLPLATGDVPEMCVGPLESIDRPVVASGRNVPMPGYLIDTLVREIRSEKAIFYAKLLTYSQDSYWWSYVTSRWVGVGDAVAGRGATH